MDLVTATIVGALSTGAIQGLTETSKTTITDANTRLKALLKQKFGDKSDLVRAVEQVEAKPTSSGRKAMLQEEVAVVKADQDQDILQAVQVLQQALQAIPPAGQHGQVATGSYIAQADHNSRASVNIGHPSKDPEEQ